MALHEMPLFDMLPLEVRRALNDTMSLGGADGAAKYLLGVPVEEALRRVAAADAVLDCGNNTINWTMPQAQKAGRILKYGGDGER